MLIAALDPRSGKIVQVAFPDFDWGASGARMLAFIKHDDATIEGTLTRQIAGGGLPYIAYPYAVFDPKTQQMTDFSNEYYDLSLLSKYNRTQIADTSQPSPVLDPATDFIGPSLVKRVVNSITSFFSNLIGL